MDYSTGNIDFPPGSVMIKGIVKAGFEVRAKNEVIADTIQGGKVIAGGSVVAKQGGIIGGNKQAVVETGGGSVYAKFVERAKIVSGDSVVIKKSLFLIPKSMQKILSEWRGGLRGGQ